jgi:hypothetical protein
MFKNIGNQNPLLYTIELRINVTPEPYLKKEMPIKSSQPRNEAK